MAAVRIVSLMGGVIVELRYLRSRVVVIGRQVRIPVSKLLRLWLGAPIFYT
jgi:hypothetical protein